MSFPAYSTITQTPPCCNYHPLHFLIVGICLRIGKSLTIHCQKYTLHGNRMQMLNVPADQLVHSSTAGSV